MKKLFIMAAMALMSATSFAQHAVGSFTIQPKIGLNIANLTKSEGDVRAGLAAGAEVEYQASDIFSVSFGALYSMQGCKGSTDSGDATIKLDYINIPILANVYVTKGLAVKLGIQPGFNVSSKTSVKAGGVKATVDMDGVKSVDFSIPVGLSYEFNNFVIDGRYNFGVINWAKDLKLGDETLGSADSKHSVFQITVGYKFDL